MTSHHIGKKTNDQGKGLDKYTKEFNRHQNKLNTPRSLQRTLKKGVYEIRRDTAFPQVIKACAEVHRQDGVWITPTIVRGYTWLHRQGFAHSVETWREGQLVGGLYGVAIRGLFAGESMFSLEPSASKVALAHLVDVGVD